jgi:exosortase A-associated hydrolase 1
MGDSEGEERTFEQTGDDIAAAIDFLHRQPGVRDITAWGLCDAASSALMFCGGDPRIRSLVLLNPWARSEASLAATHLKHYYLRRVLQPDLWARAVRGRFEWRAALAGLLASLRKFRKPVEEGPQRSFQERMAEGWRRFAGPVLLILSGRDLTAKEFLEYAAAHQEWKGLLAQTNVRRIDLSDADHTFSDLRFQAEVEALTLSWLKELR